jgi:hypothetical protein
MTTALRRFWIRISTDRRRLGVLCAAVGVGLLLWARVIVIGNIPRQAVAGLEAQFLQQQAPPDRVASAPRRKRVALDATPRRDPFLISPIYFPKATPPPQLPTDEGKSAAETLDSGEQADARKLAQLRSLAERFQLEAVMTGSPMAVINGRTYRTGDVIPAVGNEQVRFTLSEVRSRSVVLTYEEHRFELTFAQPGRTPIEPP